MVAVAAAGGPIISGGRVSFIIAVYNGEKYIREAVESCLNQTHPDVEVVVTDDGSTDGTLSLLRAAFGSDSRVRILSFEKNRGKVAAYNNSFTNSTGDYIAVMGGDDVCLRERVALSLEALVRRGAEMVCGDCLKMLDETPSSRRLAAEYFGIKADQEIEFGVLVRRHIVFGGTLLGTREAFKAIFPIPETFRREDSWLAMASAYRRPIAYIDKPLIYYRIHNTNSSWLNANQDFISWVEMTVRELLFFRHASTVFRMTRKQSAIWDLRAHVVELLREKSLLRRIAMALRDIGRLVDLRVPLAIKLRFLVALASPKLGYRISRFFTLRMRGN